VVEDIVHAITYFLINVSCPTFKTKKTDKQQPKVVGMNIRSFGGKISQPFCFQFKKKT